jgi:hypothetical protein
MTCSKAGVGGLGRRQKRVSGGCAAAGSPSAPFRFALHEFAQQLDPAFDAFVAAEARNLDVIVCKYFYFYALADECDRQPNAIRATLSL